MSSLASVVYYMTKEAVKPRLQHKNLEEYLDDVDIDCFRHTHSFEHMKYIRNVYKLIKDIRKE